MHRHLMSSLKWRPLQLQCLHSPSDLSKTRGNHHLLAQLTSSARRHASSRPPHDGLFAFQADARQQAHHRRRAVMAAGGLVASLVATALLLAFYPVPKPPTQCEAHPNSPSFPTQPGTIIIESRKNSTQKGSGDSADASADLVPTGTSSVPFFPKTIYLPTTAASAPAASLPAGTTSSTTTASTVSTEPYQLLGLGIRTVSFLSIQVYVVGLYVATADVPALQSALAQHAAGPSATTLVATERNALRAQLLDDVHGIDAWTDVLAGNTDGGGWRSALRVVPTRTTDFAHLRDGWVRGLVAAAGQAGWSEDAVFGEAVGAFKALFGGRKGVRKGRAVVLGREKNGQLEVWLDGEEGGEKGRSEERKEETEWLTLGVVEDERISRGIWLAYLGGKKVASEEARRSIVDGMVKLGERPVGTIETVV